MNRRVLLLDTDPAAAAPLAAALPAAGFVLAVVPTPDALLAAAAAAPEEVALLRRAAPPPWCGLEVLRRLRAASPISCLLLGLPGDGPQESVAALEAGADDYLHAAMLPVEAVARIRAVLRRTRPAEPLSATPLEAEARRAWRLAPGGRQLVAPQGAAQKLTAAEFELLRLLAAAAGEPVDRDVICQRVFRRPWRIDDRSVDGLVKRLRRKMDPEAIQSVRGVGYALSVTVHTS
jgi:DNA-binding response OmpR family regulator